MRNMRHQVDVMLPTDAEGSLGQLQGDPTVYMRNVPCSIETLSGRTGELVRQNFPTSTHQVEMYGDPKKPITEKHYLQFGSRRLNIDHANDVHQNGLKYILLCGEAK